MKNSRFMILSIFLVAITWAIFAQTGHSQFVNYDDPLYVLENAHVRSGLSWRGIEWAFTHVHSQNWHPLTTMSHMLDCQLFGLNSGAQHLVNVFWHGIAALLLFILLRQATGSVWRSVFVAAVFAIHPLRVESVAWISERKDVLSGALFMLTLLAYVHWTRKRTLGRYVTMSIFFACGLMSKPMLVTTPIVLLLLDYWPLNRFPKATIAKLVIEKIPPENRLEIWRLLLAAFVLITITAIAFVRRRQNPYLIVGWLWYVVMLIPVIGFVQVGLQGHADRYTYLPQIGLVFALVWLVWDLTISLRAQKVILRGSALFALATLSILSWRQMTHWRDTETLWRHTLAVTPNSDVAHAGLGGILFVRGQIDEAIDHYERALRLRDGNVGAQFGLARALAAENKTDAAIQHLQKTLQLQPDYVAASNDLGALLATKGEIKGAIAAWRQTLSFDADNPDAANNIAWMRATAADADLRDGKEAVDLAKLALRSGGENPVSLRTLAAAQAENGQFAGAIATAERAAALAQRNGDKARENDLRQCIELFRRGEALHRTQVSH